MDVRRHDWKVYGLAAWAYPDMTWAGARDARREREHADPSEPVLKDGDILSVRVGARIGDTGDSEPGEAVTVRWQGVNQHTCGRVVLMQRRLTLEAAALSWMTSSPYDVRPHLLLLNFGEVATSVEPCIRYGVNYLRHWCEVCGIGRGWGTAFRFAAADAMARVYWGRDTRGTGRPTIEERRAKLRIGDSYGMLVTKLESVFRTRLFEAIMRFELQFADTGLLAPPKSYSDSRDKQPAAAKVAALLRRAA